MTPDEQIRIAASAATDITCAFFGEERGNMNDATAAGWIGKFWGDVYRKALNVLQGTDQPPAGGSTEFYPHGRCPARWTDGRQCVLHDGHKQRLAEPTDHMAEDVMWA